MKGKLGNADYRELGGEKALQLWKKGADEWNKNVLKENYDLISFAGIDFATHARDKSSDEIFDPTEGKLGFAEINYPLDHPYTLLNERKNTGYYSGRVIDFEGYVFPCSTTFQGASFENLEICFDEAEFHGWFLNLMDCRYTLSRLTFYDTRFVGAWVYFQNTQFHESSVDMYDISLSDNGRFLFEDVLLERCRCDFEGNKFEGYYFGLCNTTFRRTNFNFIKNQVSGGNIWLRDLVANDSSLVFSESVFQHADFSRSSIKNTRVDLDNTCFDSVKFDNAVFESSTVSAHQASFGEAFSWGRIDTPANFQECDLGSCDLAGVSLDNLDLRGAQFTLNDNSIVGARFDHDSTDPYNVLRRTYSGYRFTLILLFTVLSMLPFAAKAIIWSSIGEIEEKALLNLQLLAGENHALNKSVQIIRAEFECEGAVERCPTTLEFVMGATGGASTIFEVLLTAMILAYVGIRAWVTLQITALREAEERSGATPPIADYQSYQYIDRFFLRWVFWLVVVVSTYRVLAVLLQPVWIP